MREIECEQGSPEWHQARLGVPSASCFDKIVTPAKGEYSKSAKPYMLQLLLERLTGETQESLDGLPAIERGKALEPKAVTGYELETGEKTRAAGFCLTNDCRFGASPDRILTSTNGGLELKCPNSVTHLGYWAHGFGNDYKCQRMGQMWVCEFDFVDMVSFHPRLPSAIERVYRDEPFIKTMADALNKFHDEMMELETRLRATGFFEAQTEDDWRDMLEGV